MLSPQPSTPASLSSETSLSRALRVLVGIALTVQSFIFFSVSCAFAVFTLLLGGMAFIAGGGGATDQQTETTWLIIFLIAFYPFAWTLMLVVSAINIFLRTRALLIVTLCMLSILSEIGIAIYASTLNRASQTPMPIARWMALGILMMLVLPLAGVIVALTMKPRRANDQAD